MNDYFLRSMMRQRHEQILAEVRAARLSQLDRPRMGCGLKKKICMFRSFFRQSKSSMVYKRPVLDERKSI